MAQGMRGEMLEKFLNYFASRPDIWQAFEKVTLRLIERGVERIGAKCIMENIRYGLALKNGKDEFKICNTYTAGYARVFAIKHPQHADFFELRECK